VLYTIKLDMTAVDTEQVLLDWNQDLADFTFWVAPDGTQALITAPSRENAVVAVRHYTVDEARRAELAEQIEKMYTNHSKITVSWTHAGFVIFEI
jgi:hypothetical protein